MDVDDQETLHGTKRKAEDASLRPDSPKRIKALSQDVVNKIAAGEIIIAPVHALKELTENAVDAGATALEILVKDGGLKLLQITDNGHGITKDDLPILCERFTTSKLKSFEDLTSIGTYGFRGEALASISHIAHLQITTRTQQSSCAYRASYSGGKLVAPKPGQSAEPKACAGRQGTQIAVEDLFYNVPTRRRAFRSPGEEYSKILELVGRYAVHCSGVAFSCKKHGDASMGISVAANATTVDRIRQIHGSAVANELIDFKAENESWGFSCDGWISNANYHVKKLALLLFINHRSVESSAIKKAVEHTYSTFLPKGGHPFVYLSLNIDPGRLDVNVHPTKKQVNFLNEDEIIDVICEEIRARLGKVDTSRTFMTQTLLPGVKLSTVGQTSSDAPQSRNATYNDNPGSSTKNSTYAQRTLVSTKPYENNMIRTDSRARKITSMLPKSTARPSALSQAPNIDASGNTELGDKDAMEYTCSDKQPTIIRLISIKELRAAVRDNMHASLTDAISSHTFVGVVDTRRRIAAIQSGVKLYLADYGMLAAEYFYQVGLTDFANFGRIQLDPPLVLHELLDIAVESEQRSAESKGEVNDDFDWSTVAPTVHAQLLSRRAMLSEYFGMDISESGEVCSLPLLIKGYMPSLAKLPGFLLRLGPYVDWNDEKECFATFLRELAVWYAPEVIPNAPMRRRDVVHSAQSHAEADAKDDAETNGNHNRQPADENDEDPAIASRREEITRALEHVLFPAFKSRLIATKGMLKGVLEVANLKGLYRVFERC